MKKNHGYESDLDAHEGEVGIKSIRASRVHKVEMKPKSYGEPLKPMQPKKKKNPVHKNKKGVITNMRTKHY